MRCRNMGKPKKGVRVPEVDHAVVSGRMPQPRESLDVKRYQFFRGQGAIDLVCSLPSRTRIALQAVGLQDTQMSSAQECHNVDGSR